MVSYLPMHQIDLSRSQGSLHLQMLCMYDSQSKMFIAMSKDYTCSKHYYRPCYFLLILCMNAVRKVVLDELDIVPEGNFKGKSISS